MFRRDPWSELIAGGRGRPPRLLVGWLVLLAVGIVVDGIPELAEMLDPLRLSTRVWTSGQPWRLVTYGFVGVGGLSLWAAFQLLALYWFSMELVAFLGLARTRNLIVGGLVVAGTAGSMVQWLSDLLGGPGCPWAELWMVQGQSVGLTIVMAAFATHARWTTVSNTTLMMGLPIPSRWLVPILLLVATASFVATRDLGGFVGVTVALSWGVRMSRRPRGRLRRYDLN
jgi:hypothetical protein